MKRPLLAGTLAVSLAGVLLMPATALAETDTTQPGVSEVDTTQTDPSPTTVDPSPTTGYDGPWGSGDGDEFEAPTITPDDTTDLPPSDLGASDQAPTRRDAAMMADSVRKAQVKAQEAVDESRAAYNRALAKFRVARFEVADLLRRSAKAEALAERLLRDLGNLARMAYSSGDSNLNLVAKLIDSPDPQDVLAGAAAVERVSSHKEVQWADATEMQQKADDLADEARTVKAAARDRLADAKSDLDQAMALAKAVDLAVDPLGKVPPVDLRTESDWVFPTAAGSISSEAGMRMHPIMHILRCHEGADITAPAGTLIYAVDDGIVIRAGVNGGYGNYTEIAHGGGLTSGYAHQQKILVEVGDRVTKGQVIGEVGTTGLSTGPHLHFEARYHGIAYNPRGWLEEDKSLRAPVC